MKKLTGLVLLICAMAATQLHAQAAAAPSPTAAAPATGKSSKEKSKSAGTNPLQLDNKTASNEPTTTEIYADEAFFDSNKNMGIFSGRVKVTDPRFNLQSEKLTVYISKGEKQGLEKAIAEGNVAVVRDRPDPNGGPPTRSVGRSDKATYFAATGDVELEGTPRVQEGINTHMATSPDTVMIINQKGELKTHGPSRTEIRQPPPGQAGPSATPTPTP
jgi:lipopolysaccharide transport protein LptA